MLNLHPFMPAAHRWNRITAITLVLGSLSACDPALEPIARAVGPGQQTASMSPRPEAPKLIVQTPQYPAAVIYILYREYLHKNPGLVTLSPDDPKYQRYLERRLHQLYPGRGYNGMTRDAAEEQKRHRLAWAEYQKQLRAWRNSIGILVCDGQTDIDPETGVDCFPPADDGGTTATDPTVDSSWDGSEEHLVPSDETIPTLQMEIDTLQMSSIEVTEINYQESLATGSFFELRDEVIVTSTGARATIDDLIRAAGDGWTPPNSVTQGRNSTITIQVDPVTISAIVVSVAVIGWKAWRVRQAADRARQKSEEYYPNQQYSSTQRDAHRHIFFNMQSRRYIGGYLTKQISDNHENNGNNAPADWAMDLHNNDIGRDHKYKNFRGHWLWDRWDWQEWAEKVRNYINYSPNAEYLSEWQTNPPTTRNEASSRTAMVPDAKYIYYLP
jgi:hypothetical protein